MKVNKLTYLIFGFFSTLVFIILAATDSLSFSQFYDFLMRREKLSAPIQNIVIIEIDDSSLNAIKQIWPWDRKIYAETLQNLIQQKPKVIGLDLLFTQKTHSQSDELIQKTIEESKIPIVLAFNFYASQKSEWIESQKLNLMEIGIDLPVFGKYFGFVNLIKDSDGYIRRIKLSQSFDSKTYSSFSLVLAEKYLSQSIFPPEKELIIHYTGENVGTFPKISFFQAYQNQIPKEFLKDKIVLIGPSFAASKDFYMTPFYDTESGKNHISGVEIFAHAVHTLLEKIEYHRPSLPITSIIIILLNILAVIMFLFLNSIQRIFLFSGVLLIYLASLIWLFFDFQIQLSMLPLINFILTFPVLLFIHQSFEIYFKNQIIATFKEKAADKKKKLFEKFDLSEREQEVISLLIEGYKNPQIAKKLFISLNTVKFHIKNIYDKTKVASRVKLMKLLHPEE